MKEMQEQSAIVAARRDFAKEQSGKQASYILKLREDVAKAHR